MSTTKTFETVDHIDNFCDWSPRRRFRHLKETHDFEPRRALECDALEHADDHDDAGHFAHFRIRRRMVLTPRGDKVVVGLLAVAFFAAGYVGMMAVWNLR